MAAAKLRCCVYSAGLNDSYAGSIRWYGQEIEEQAASIFRLIATLHRA